MSGKRGNGEGSIYPYRNGYAAYAWVTTPEGNRRRKYVYGPTRKDVHEKWLKLHNEAKKGPVATKTPTLAQYLAYWLKEVVEPNLRPLTAATYETTVRLYIVPLLGSKRLDRLTVQDMRGWLNKLADTCPSCSVSRRTLTGDAILAPCRTPSPSGEVRERWVNRQLCSAGRSAKPGGR